MSMLIPGWRIVIARRMDEMKFTRRHREVAWLMLAGYSREEIADQLFVAPNTVRNHIARIFQLASLGGVSHASRRAMLLLALLDIDVEDLKDQIKLEGFTP